jgi:hypothetical protein
VTATDAAGNTAVKTVSYSVAVPTMNIAGCTANEGANCTFTVTLSNPSSQNVSVNYATADGTATAPGRYAATSGVLTFTPGQTSKQVPVATVAAGTQQLDQTFTMTLTSPVAATLGTDTATGTVHDVSSTPKLVGQAATVHRAGLVTNTVIASVPVVLSNQFGQPQTSGLTVTANWSTLDWSAHAPQDYAAASGTLTYLPGETIKYIDVQVPYSALASLDRVGFILIDHMVNATPGGFVNLEAASPYTIAFFGITTDNPWPVLSMNNVTASVPAGGAAWVTFTVDQSAPLSDDLRGVTFTTADGTAVAGSDYDARTGTILWAPNAAGSRTVSVRVHPTGAAGTSKTVKLVLSNVGGPATLHATKYIATATINIT